MAEELIKIATKDDVYKSNDVLGTDAGGNDVTVQDVVNTEGWDGRSQLADAARALVTEEDDVNEETQESVGEPAAKPAEPTPATAPVTDNKWTNDKDL